MKDRVAQDSGIIHQNIDAAEGIERGLDDLLGIFRLDDRERRCDRLAARFFDCLGDLLRRTDIAAGALQTRPDVADDDATPSSAMASAIARPIPRPAPVTIATLPASMPSAMCAPVANGE